MSTKNIPSPITNPATQAELFVGRRQITRRVLDYLAPPSQSVFIVGPDRIGKTSFLHHLADPSVRAQNRIAEDLVFVYVDCRSLVDSDPEMWYRQIEESTLRQIENSAPQNVEPIRTGFEESIQGNAPSPADRLRYLFRAVQRQGSKLVLALDDFEALIYNPRLDLHFLEVLRAQHADCEVTYLVTSLLPLQDHQYMSENSHFFNIFRPMGQPSEDLFGPLSSKESQTLVLALLDQAGIKEPPSPVMTCILELGNRRPYDLQRASKIAIREWPREQQIDARRLCGQIQRQFD